VEGEILVADGLRQHFFGAMRCFVSKACASGPATNLPGSYIVGGNRDQTQLEAPLIREVAARGRTEATPIEKCRR